MPVYASDPNAAPDAQFEPGRLEHLVVGNAGRLLDARRTPVRLTGIELASGQFVAEVRAFEDQGASWRVPFEEVQRFQFVRGAAHAAADELRLYRAAVARFDRQVSIEATASVAQATRARLIRERSMVRERLDALGVPAALDAAVCIERREGDPELVSIVQAILAERDLAGLDHKFAAQYVSNPWSGDLVKGHAIVAGELGIAAYRGKVMRDPQGFAAEWSKARRAEHLLLRLALITELWSRTGHSEVLLYRAVASEMTLSARLPTVFVSATFSREVAEEQFAGGPRTRAAALYRKTIPLERLFMTFWETPALNSAYREAEAVLIGSAPEAF
ncbi:MAG: hypothetical protein M3Z06_00660 [Actinomycetota bacterium]|nr:hypothetical protein [Actinomycetota bacterium]